MHRSSLTLVAVCTGWGTIPFLARHVDLPAAAIVFSRVWIATAALALVMVLRRHAAPPPATVPTSGSASFRLRVLAAGADW